MFYKLCTSDEDFAKVSLFLFKNRHDIHRAYTTFDMIQLLYSYVTQGHIIQVLDTENRVIGATAYFHGTPEKNFADKHLAFVDIAISDKEYRTTRLFLDGLDYLIKTIIAEHPEVEEVQLATHSENRYLIKLYSKFMKVDQIRSGPIGEETIFCEKIQNISTFLKRFLRV